MTKRVRAAWKVKQHVLLKKLINQQRKYKFIHILKNKIKIKPPILVAMQIVYLHYNLHVWHETVAGRPLLLLSSQASTL